ncbi:MAG: hypothetical protein K6E38_04720 [Fretibacterium sp.]|nr:hypothetical protein [Fretibacterium sp.]
MQRLFKFTQILLLAFGLVAMGAMAPMEETDAVWGDDPKHVVEVFRTGKCNSYSGGWWDFIKKVFTGKWSSISFKYCPCIPMDLGELTDLSKVLTHIWDFVTSIPSGFWKGEWDIGIKTKDPQLEKTMKQVWEKSWEQDAMARELVIQAEAMIKSITIARSRVFGDAFEENMKRLRQGKGNMYSVNYYNQMNKLNNLMGRFPDAYTKLTPMEDEEKSFNSRFREIEEVSLLAMKAIGNNYDGVKDAINALYNELIKDDGEKDPLKNVDTLFKNITKVIESAQKILNDKSGGWAAVAEIPLLINGVTEVMNSLENALNIGGFGFNKRMMLYQVLNALMDDVVKNVLVWGAAVLDKNPTYPLTVVKDSVMPVLKDMMFLLFLVPPEKGQTKMLQLATAMADQQAGLTELNEHAFMKFQDVRMWAEQARKSKNMAIQKNMEIIGHEAATVQGQGKSHKIGF